MAELGFLPRTLIAKSGYGTAFYWDRRQGLLALDERSGDWRLISTDDLRLGYPEVWWHWVRFAGLLPPGELMVPHRSGHHPGGGHAA